MLYGPYIPLETALPILFIEVLNATALQSPLG